MTSISTKISPLTLKHLFIMATMVKLPLHPSNKSNSCCNYVYPAIPISVLIVTTASFDIGIGIGIGIGNINTIALWQSIGCL